MKTKDIRLEKKQLVTDMTEMLASSSALFLVAYKGLNVENFSALRAELANLQAECHVVPNRLFLKAVAEQEIECLQGYELNGDTALITGGSDVVAVAKAITKFASAHQALQVKIGVLNNQLLTVPEVDHLAKMPSREILLAQLLGVLQAPARNTAGVLYNRIASIVYVLNAYTETRSQDK